MSQASNPKVRNTLSANEPLKCPTCGETQMQRQRGIIERVRGRGLKIYGKEFGYFSRKQIEQIWCEHCGYTYYRYLE